MRKTLVAAAVLIGAVVVTVAMRPVVRESECCDPRADGILSPWVAHLRSVNDAIEARDAGRAVRAWRDAWGAALATPRWEALSSVGDAALRVGDLVGIRGPARADARQAYHAALFRAYGQRSPEGVLRAAEAMAAMGDVQLLEAALHLARKLGDASPDPEVRDWVERDVARIAGRTTTYASTSPQPLAH